MSVTEDWLATRLRSVPPELREDILSLVAAVPPADRADPASALAAAALRGLEQVVTGSGSRRTALRLLAADAALTYAFEAASEQGRSAELAERVGLRGEIGARLAREAGGPGERPGEAE